MSSPNSHTGKSTDKTTGKAAGPDATKLLEHDHREVARLFKSFEHAPNFAAKADIAEQICLALKVHMQVEEELFYPASRDALKARQEDMVDEAVVEHAAAKQLVGEIEGMEPGDDLYDAKVQVLSEQIDHHVEEEETELFPAVRKTDLDLHALGAKMEVRKEELTTKLARSNGKKVG